MTADKARRGMVVPVRRPHGAAGKSGTIKAAFSAICGEKHLPLYGVLDGIYPRFAVLAMLGSPMPENGAEKNGTRDLENARRLYREAFFWEEVSER